ncbi:flagellar protein FlbD [Spirochaetia bacterium]|nr:flagellar protein FlbD [Spirochaetia bacterium]GHT57297.1 flagellar protein FlbD [Spirochaetia bacterium]GHU89705.1 flagellar protein FlbD [Spirochaetia bacterium]
MIKVSRLDGVEYYLNPHQIETIEVHPDTTLVLLSGKKLIVKEGVDELLKRIEDYRRRLFPSMGEE